MSMPTAGNVPLASVLRDEAIDTSLAGPETAPVVTALRAAHARSASKIDEPTPGLQSAICAYIAQAKSDGWLIEHAVVRLKRAMADAGLWADGGTRAAINTDVITRCIREYYRQ